MLTNKSEAWLERDVVSNFNFRNVAAGSPIMADEHVEDVLKFDQSIIGGKLVFCIASQR